MGGNGKLIPLPGQRWQYQERQTRQKRLTDDPTSAVGASDHCLTPQHRSGVSSISSLKYRSLEHASFHVVVWTVLLVLIPNLREVNMFGTNVVGKTHQP